jgi:hypothetical protein
VTKWDKADGFVRFARPVANMLQIGFFPNEFREKPFLMSAKSCYFAPENNKH